MTVRITDDWRPSEDTILEQGLEQFDTFATISTRLPGRSASEVHYRAHRKGLCSTSDLDETHTPSKPRRFSWSD